MVLLVLTYFVYEITGRNIPSTSNRLKIVVGFSSMEIMRLIPKRRVIITLNSVGFEVLTAVSMKIAVFWVVTPCSLVEAMRPDDGGSKDL
jgi:hypothetical protein